MNLSHHCPSLNDPTWIEQAIKDMGENEFLNYRDRIYLFLDKLEVGKMIDVLQWTKPESLDLFIKIAYCYVSESQCFYAFNNQYTIIKHQFDAREMEITLALLKRQRREKELTGDGEGTGSESGGTKAVPTP